MAKDKDRRPPDGSAGQLPEIPAEAQQQIIIAAAAVSGRPANEITLAEALEILQGDNPNPLLNAAMKRAAEDAAEVLFGDITDEQAAALAEAAQKGELQEGLTAAVMAIINKYFNGAEDQPGADQEGGTEPVKENPAAPADDPDDRRDVIRIDTRIDPDGFDPEKTAAKVESLKQTVQRISKGAEAAYKGIFAAANVGNVLAAQVKEMQETFSGITDTVIQAARAASLAAQPGTWQRIRDALQEIAENAPVWLELANEVAELEPFIAAELKKPEYEGKTLDDLYETGTNEETGEIIPGSLFDKLLTAARAARDVKQPHAAIKRADTVEYPLDKPNSIIWNLLEKDTAGQISFNMAKSGSRKNIPAYYAINFDELGNDIQITKRLLPFDKRVYIAVSALFNAGNNVITLTQIHYAMGNTGRPSVNQLEKINNSISKMMSAKIFFDNKQEAETYKYQRFKYDGFLLPLERGTAIVNGQLADAAIHIFREPPLISFAKQRRQVTTVDVKLLQSPVSKTDANLLIEDYLLERISKEKKTKAKRCRILFDTLYKHTGVNTVKQKQRTPDKIKKYLDHYQQERFITRYTMETDGITIYWG